MGLWVILPDFMSSSMMLLEIFRQYATLNHETTDYTDYAEKRYYNLSENDLLYSEFTRPVIGAAMEVHKILGSGFLESVYEEAFAIELDLNKIPYERQKSIEVVYKNRPAKYFTCDFLVYGKIIVELKAIRKITDIETSQLLNYLKVCNLNLGLLVNFGSNSLEFKRIINTNR
ncbi:MAG: GxxExxY protein [Phycisphaerae bacterium]|nr:GxxExxY protein [Phycisphaerae bacterium]